MREYGIGLGEDWKVVFCPNVSSMLTIDNLGLIKVMYF